MIVNIMWNSQDNLCSNQKYQINVDVVWDVLTGYFDNLDTNCFFLWIAEKNAWKLVALSY